MVESMVSCVRVCELNSGWNFMSVFHMIRIHANN